MTNTAFGLCESEVPLEPTRYIWYSLPGAWVRCLSVSENCPGVRPQQ